VVEELPTYLLGWKVGCAGTGRSGGSGLGPTLVGLARHGALNTALPGRHFEQMGLPRLAPH